MLINNYSFICIFASVDFGVLLKDYYIERIIHKGVGDVQIPFQFGCIDVATH